MRPNFCDAQIVTWILAGCVALAVPAIHAQAQSTGSAQQQQDQNQKGHEPGLHQRNEQKSAPQQSTPQQPVSQPQNGNPFPGDENAAPVMPSSNTPEMTPGETSAAPAVPAVDRDPVRSPDDANAPDSGDTQGFSSSSSGLDNLVKPPDTDTGSKNGGKGDLDEMPRETPKEDVDVGNYYMDRKDWKGALSRFQSALVLAPDNPDVYWGLAQCERQLGQFSEARENYLKVEAYDPGSHHAKEAKKALKDPEIANAKAPSGSSAH